MTALQGIDLEIPRGRIFGLIGPDGAGKTTLLKIIAGILSYDRGEVIVMGTPLVSEAAAETIKERLGFMPQGLGLNLYPELTVEENLRFFAELRLVSPDEYRLRRQRLLETTRLVPFGGRKMKALSGGMKQKLALACTLIHEPELIILDEPTTGVDPLSRQELWGIIAELVAEKAITAIISTAYLDEAKRFHDLALVSSGQIIAKGSPEDLAEEDLEECFRKLSPDRSRRSLRLPPSFEKKRTKVIRGPVIEARGLTKDFGSFRAVDKVSFRVEAGEIFGLLGPNGAGKTTVVRMLCGLVSPTQGWGLVAGVEMSGSGRRIRQRIGYMSQNFSLYQDLTALENLWLYAGIYGVKQERRILQDLADLCELKGYEDRRTAELPLGVRQRLALACAIVHRPQVVFLDEPTSGVDPPGRERFWQIIRLLAKELEITALVTTHYMTEAEYCDHLCLMHDGRIIAEGSPQKLKAQVEQRIGQPISILAPDPLAVLKRLKAGGIQASLYGATVRAFVGAEGPGKIRELLGLEKGLRVRAAEITMEDVFVYHIMAEEDRNEMASDQGLS
ncbi:ATP-binding cassette domain-containing protein [Thermosulfuriphilus sp.]